MSNPSELRKIVARYLFIIKDERSTDLSLTGSRVKAAFSDSPDGLHIDLEACEEGATTPLKTELLLVSLNYEQMENPEKAVLLRRIFEAKIEYKGMFLPMDVASISGSILYLYKGPLAIDKKTNISEWAFDEAAFLNALQRYEHGVLDQSA
jgi:hypothetical protein